MKHAYMVLLVLVVVFVAGCTSTPAGQAIKDVDGEARTVVKTDEGAVEVTAKEGSAGWCQEGAEWTMTSAAEGANAQWIVDRLEKSGEYAGYCHVIYKATSPDGDLRMDYWFDESGENGYYEMDVGGQKIKQEWHG
ncbi:hypothetical protein JXA12_03340 [Candidatus Woesearchaeota archaeon]|nr:hypothetical protein [Candidatus Woesearchaeota archaeon]